MPNKISDDRTRVTYLEEADIVEELLKLAERNHISVSQLLREATYRLLHEQDPAQGIRLSPRPPKEEPRKQKPKKRPSS